MTTPEGKGISRVRIRTLNQINAMRLIKSSDEIALMKKAVEITCDAHIEAMKASTPGLYEYEIEAIIEYIYRKNGSPRFGFPSIVGSGPNSCVLHYESNNRKTRNGDMFCIDIGAEYGYYSADITRSYPVNGIFTPEQRDIYEIVLAAEEATILAAGPAKSFREIKQLAFDVLADGLFKLGLITDRNARWQARLWTPHGIGHWLGLDVHDVGGGDSSTGDLLKPGMIFTIEPGIYIAVDRLDNIRSAAGRSPNQIEIDAFIEMVKPLAERYNNIGVRIEDDILITEKGYENLSVKAPKEIKDIEMLMAQRSYLNR